MCMRKILMVLVVITYLMMMGISCSQHSHDEKSHTHEQEAGHSHGDQQEHSHENGDHHDHEQEEFVAGDSTDHVHDGVAGHP